MIDFIAEIKNIAISLWGSVSGSVMSMINNIGSWATTTFSAASLNDINNDFRFLYDSFQNQIVKNIEDGIYTSNIKSKSANTQSGVFEALLENGEDFVEEKNYGNLYLYLKNNYLSIGAHVIDDFTSNLKLRTYQLNHYLAYPKLKYAYDPLTLTKDASNGFMDMREITLDYERKLYELKTSNALYQQALNNILRNGSSYLKSFVAQYDAGNPDALSSDREQTDYQGLLGLNGKVGVYGDDRDDYLLAAMNGSVNFLTEATIKLGIRMLAAQTLVMALRFYKDFFTEKGQEFANTISAAWSEITNSNERYYDYEYFFAIKNKNNADYSNFVAILDGEVLDPSIISHITYTTREIKVDDYFGKYYKEYYKEGKTYFGPPLSYNADPDSDFIPNRNDIAGLKGTEARGVKFSIKYPISFIIKRPKIGAISEVLYLSTDYGVCRMDLGNLSENFWKMITDSLNNSILDIRKLYNGYGVYNGYSALFEIVSNNNFVIDNLEKLRLTEFIYSLIDFFEGDNETFNEKKDTLKTKIAKAYGDLVLLEEFHECLLKEFAKDQKYKCPEKFED